MYHIDKFDIHIKYYPKRKESSINKVKRKYDRYEKFLKIS